MRKKPIVIGAIAFIIMALIFLNLLKGPAKTVKHVNWPNSSAMTSSKPLQYDIDDYTIKFVVPEATEVYVSSVKGIQIRFSTYLVNSKSEFRGYLQLWKVKDLEHFLTDAKSLSPLDFRSYKVSNFQQGKYHGYIIEWTTEFGEKSTSGKEYWLVFDNTEYVVRISLITDTTDFPSNLQNVIEQIFDSLQIDKK